MCPLLSPVWDSLLTVMTPEPEFLWQECSWARWWRDFMFRYWSVCLLQVNCICPRGQSLPFMTSMPSSSYVSIINWMLLVRLLMCTRKESRSVLPWNQMESYHLQIWAAESVSMTLFISLSSSSSINKLYTTGGGREGLVFLQFGSAVHKKGIHIVKAICVHVWWDMSNRSNILTGPHYYNTPDRNSN